MRLKTGVNWRLPGRARSEGRPPGRLEGRSECAS